MLKLTIALIGFATSTCLACGIDPEQDIRRDPAHAMERAEFVAVARVLASSKLDDPQDLRDRVELKIEQLWKGDALVGATIINDRSLLGCASRMEVGFSYLIFAHGEKGAYVVYGEAVLISEAEQIVRALGPTRH